ncbi:MAG: hypothetical protein FWG05_02265 [Kiritimatiellaeota bacterium]|nr:hypothetical protein [Kiritimatiellota bacterium]
MKKHITRIFLICLPALLLVSGCQTAAMKSTPFFTGERNTPKGKPEDRVNVFPLAYYNEPDLSFLWPLGQYTDTKLAFFPLFSLFRDAPEKPYSELNILWPLSQLHLNKNDQRRYGSYAFPFFWGDDYFVAFPLYWNLGKPFASENPRGANSLFPLWIYDVSGNDYELDLLWPFINIKHHGKFRSWRVFPLAGANNGEYDNSAWWLAGLGGYDFTRGYMSHWQFPFYYYERQGENNYTFLSPLWCQTQNASYSSYSIPPLLTWRVNDDFYSLGGLLHINRNGDSGHLFPFYHYVKSEDKFLSLPYSHFNLDHNKNVSLIPPLLTWWTRDNSTDTRDFYALGGLYHRRTGGATVRIRSEASSPSRSWLIPFYADSEDSFLSLAYTRVGDTRIVPPLLSWRHNDLAAETTSLNILGGLYHAHSVISGETKERWFLPFFYRSREPDILVTPLWARNRDPDGALSWNIVPPLLSWRYDDPATDTKSLYALGGLYHRRTGGAPSSSPSRSWLFPIFAQGSGTRENDDYFLSLAYSHFDNTTLIPPLLSWQTSDPATNEKDLYALGGLFHQNYGNPKKSAGHFFPFYAYNHDAQHSSDDYFFSLAYTHIDDTSVIPPLLTWWTRDPFTDERDLNILLGLYNSKTSADGKLRSELFFPFYSRGDDYFITLPYARSGNTRVIPPLLSWWERKPDHYETDLFLFGGIFYNRFQNGDGGQGWLLPFYAYGENQFYTPLFGWDNSSSKRLRYYLTPLVGTSYSNGARKHWFYPFYSHKTNGEKITGDPLEQAGRIFDEYDTGSRYGFTRNVYDSETSVLFGLLSNSESKQQFQREGYNRHKFVDNSSAYLFPLWSSSRETTLSFDDDLETIVKDETHEKNSILLFLYDYKHERYNYVEHDYVRRRVLWRLYHYERLNGDVALDIFPAITWDSKTDGARKFSFLWRFFRYESAPDTPTKLDILFIPIKR